jgi:hypothetical protein
MDFPRNVPWGFFQKLFHVIPGIDISRWKSGYYLTIWRFYLLKISSLPPFLSIINAAFSVVPVIEFGNVTNIDRRE